MKRNGRSPQRKQRWRCQRCGRAFVWQNKATKRARQRVWFFRWLTEGYTIRQLHLQSNHSTAHLRRLIGYWLDRPPWPNTTLAGHAHLILDGTYLEQHRGVIAVMDAAHHEIIAGSYGLTESAKDMAPYLGGLRERGLNPQSVTVDGNPGVIKALRQCWPDLIIQRCLVHVQRQGLMWCRQRPKRTDAKHLRQLFLALSSIRTTADRTAWLARLAVWEQCYGQHIGTTPEYGWVFSDLKRARSMLLTALPDLFHYLTNPHIPRSTNGLEGYFARLKLRYRQHRGLATHRRAAYFQWYFMWCQR